MEQGQSQQCVQNRICVMPLIALKRPKTIYKPLMKTLFLPLAFRGKFRNPNQQMRALRVETVERVICLYLSVNLICSGMYGTLLGDLWKYPVPQGCASIVTTF